MKKVLNGILFIFFLLLMDCCRCLSPKHSVILVRDGEVHEALFSNRSLLYTPLSPEHLELQCQLGVGEEEEVEVSYFWNLMDASLSKANTEFSVSEGVLKFLQPNYGMFECFARSSSVTSYSAIVITKHPVDISSQFKLLQGPRDLGVTGNSSVRFICEVEATIPVTFHWTFNSKTFKASHPDWKIDRVSDTIEKLYIHAVTEDDVGTVGCLVSTDSFRLYQEGSITLVNDGEREMSAPKIVSGFNTSIDSLVGESHTITCTADGWPEPEYSWRFGTQISDGKDLNVTSLSEYDNKIITCQARNDAGSDERSLNLRVYEKSWAKIREERNSRYALVGEEYRLECEYYADESWELEAGVTWEQDSETVVRENMRVEAAPGLSTLVIPNITPQDGANYSCIVRTPLDSASGHFAVKTVSPAKITHFETDKLVLLGTLTMLPCQSEGVPAPQVKWFLNDTELGSDQYLTITEDGSLRIDNADFSLVGEYICESKNQFGSERKGLFLSVANPTTPILDETHNGVEKNAGALLNLNCLAEIDPLLQETSSIAWTKDSEEVPVSWVTGPKRSTLTIPYLLREHEGLYTCHVRTLLDVIGIEIPVSVHTLPPRVFVANKELGEINGGTVVINCTAFGVPPPAIKFKFGKDEYTGQELQRELGKSQAILELINLSSDNEGEYTCLGVNEYGNSQDSIQVNVYTRSQILQGPSDRVLESGESVTMPCNVRVDSRISSSLEISWLFNEKELRKKDGIIFKKESLTLEKLGKADEGMYSCVAKTSKDQTNMTGRITVLSEAPSFISTARDIRVLEGRNTDLICQATGIPLPSIEWSFGGRLLGSRRGVLSLSSLSSDKEGNYVCIASNQYGTIRADVNVQVIKGVRKENQNLIPDIVKNIKDTITLPCDFKVDHRVEKETRFSWLKDDFPLDSSSKIEIKKDRSLKIKDIELADAGQYTCKVTTPLQEVESKISLIVSGESPEILNNFEKVTIHEGETLELQCSARGVPSPNIEWLVKDRPVSSQYLSYKETSNAEIKETKITIKNVNKGQEGVYQCVARNNVGTVVKNSNVRVIRRTKVAITSEEGRSEMVIPAGQKLKLPCKVDNDEMNRITKILWTKNNKNIQVGGEDMVDFGMDGSITIFNVQKRHEGSYKCTVTTVKDEESAELTLKVLVNAPVITRYTQDQLIFGGTNLNLECVSTGIPEPEIRWTFNKTITKVVGPTFEIKSAITTDAGEYTCLAKNSIGETQRTIIVSVVTMPRLEEIYQVKKGSALKLPCVKSWERVTSLWLKDGKPLDTLDDNVLIDKSGFLIFNNLTEQSEGEYKCRVVTGSGKMERATTVEIMPDIVTVGNTRLEVKEGENLTLKCDVLPGVNAKRMWKKDGQLVFPESGSGLDILQQGGVLIVESAKPSHSGEWECVASTAWGQDTILYWVSVPSSRNTKKPCTGRDPPIIKEIISTSNTSVVLEWEVFNFNMSCYEEFMIFWWTREVDSTHDNQTVELKHRKATINGLSTGVAYFFQVNLVRDKDLRDYMYGQTKTHEMRFVPESERLSSPYPKAVIIIVIIVIVILVSVLALLYVKRDDLSEYLNERKKKGKNVEFSEFSSRLVANPDFMASLAPQWPEPEPEPTEERPFIQHQRQMSRRGSKTSITSSWSSLFNVVSNENLSTVEQDTGTYRGRSRKE